MITKIKPTLLFFIFLLLSLFQISLAQDGSYSPYSYYKFGDETDMQNVFNSSMGHLNFYHDSIHFNFELPSSVADLQLVNYAAASAFDYYHLRSDEGTGKAGEFTVPYIILGIPIGNKTGIGFGFTPYSTSAYLIFKEKETEKIAKTGEGGMNRVFITLGRKIVKGLNLGLSFNYYFGNKTARFIHYKNDVYTITRQEDNSFYRGAGWMASLNYNYNFRSKNFFSAALIYRLNTSIESQNISTLELSDNSYGSERIIKSITLREDTTTLILPASLSLGAGVGKKKKWFLGMEWQTDFWNLYTNDFFSAPFVTYRQSYTFKSGAYWLPDYRSHVKYYKRIIYQTGIYYNWGELLIDSQPINEFGISFGLVLPMNYLFSNINLGIEYVERGKAGLLTTEEHIWKLKIGLSFNDKWFVKRKIY